ATFPDPRLRAWLDRYATYSGSDPRRTPSVLSVTSYVEQHFGAWYVRGGLRRIADALLQRCAALGVRVHLASAVAEVRTDDRGVCGVRLVDGTDVVADAVVCDADASVLYGGLLRHRAGARVARSLRPAPPTGCSSPVTTTPSSTPPWAAPPLRWPTRRSTCTRPTIRRCGPTTRRRAGSCWSTRLRTTRPAASTGTRPVSPSATPTWCW